ncbi:MAG TPA: acyl-CoA dehydrogenase family protein [Crinalium sp.]
MLLEQIELKDYRAIATILSQELQKTAVERDLRAGLPTEEIEQLKASGLLSLVVPVEYDGAGAPWTDAFKIVQELSKADGSIGQLYGNHLNLITAPQLVGTPAQAKHYYRETAQKNLFWANAATMRDNRLKIAPDGNQYRVDGVKSFGTGVAVADYRIFSAVQDGVEMPRFFVIPGDRAGVTYNNDWHNMGQRRTASGNYTFHNVRVEQDELLGPPDSPNSAFPTLLSIVAQLTKTYVYLGIAEGALETAMRYTAETAQPWLTSGVDRATQDPYLMRQYGEFWVELQAAIALADQAAQQLQLAWGKGHALTHEERGRVAITISAAKVFASRAGLKIASGIFEVMGARATAGKYGFDRYWRDLRTFTLHDPVDYKLRDIGHWFLNHELPNVTPYS